MHGDEDAQRITPKALGVLLELAREPGVTRTREDLLQRVWNGRAGDGDVLTQAVKELRRVFGDDLTTPRFIETVPRVGYRLLADVGWEDSLAGGATDDTGVVPGVHGADAALPSAAATSRRRRWRRYAALGLALPLAVWLPRYLLPRAPVLAEPMPVAAPLMLTADPGAESTPRLSPDATRLAYVAIDPGSGRQRVHVRGVNASTTLFPSEGLGEESWPVWSADGAQIAFARRQGQDCSMITVDVLGGAERLRSACPRGMFESFDWSPDGRAFAIATFDGQGTARIALRAVEGGDALPFAYAHDAAEHDLAPHYSPDGRQIAFRRGLLPYCDLYVVAAEGGEVRRVTRLAALIRGFDWLPDGSGLVFASNHAGSQALYRVDIGDGSIRALGVASAQMPDVATRGDALAFEVPRMRSVMQGVVLDGGSGEASELAPSTGSDSHAALSPDGDRIVFVSDRSGSLQLWLYEGAARQSVALTRDDGVQFLYPRWSRDGRRVLVTRRRDGRGQLVEIDLSSQAQQVVSDAALDVRFATYAPQQGYLVIDHASGSPQLLQIDAPRAAARRLRDQVAAVEADAASGRIYYSRADGAGVRVLRDAAGDEAVVAPVGNRYAWHLRRGALWYFASSETDPDEIVLRRRTLADGSDEVVWRTRASIDHRNFDLSADARRLLLVRITRDDTDIGLLRFLRELR